MKIHSQEIFRRNIQFLLFILMSVICIVTISISLVSVKKAYDPILIAIDSNGTRVVSKGDDPIFKTEVVNFINQFLFNLYNFDTNNFVQRIGFATSLMSKELWEKEQNSILELQKKVTNSNIVLNGRQVNLIKDVNNVYRAIMELKEKNRLNEKNHKVTVSITIQIVPRTSQNPYGLEVTSYEESTLSNRN